MHSIVQRPMVVGGSVVPRPMMYVALTYDHRLIDGREAVYFLRRIKDVVEDPQRLLLDIWWRIKRSETRRDDKSLCPFFTSFLSGKPLQILQSVNETFEEEFLIVARVIAVQGKHLCIEFCYLIYSLNKMLRFLLKNNATDFYLG